MADIDVITTDEAPADLLGEVRRLLLAAFAGRFADEDWEHALGGWHAVVSEGGTVLSHAAVVPRVVHVGEQPFRTGYVEGVATTATREGEGLGSLAMARLGDVLRREFEMGALSTGRHGFYGRLGWERWQGPTFARSGTDLIRTEEDDDSVMVLRFGPSAAVELGASLSCPARPGDDW